MKTIWKYPIQEEAIFEMPKGAEILSVQVQDGLPTLWALVDPDAPKERRGFLVVGTGWKLSHEWFSQARIFIGTVQLGGFVWHIFEGSDVAKNSPSLLGDG